MQGKGAFHNICSRVQQCPGNNNFSNRFYTSSTILTRTIVLVKVIVIAVVIAIALVVVLVIAIGME